MGCLYSITFPNGRQYVGITTKTAEKRFSHHARGAKNGRHYLLAKAIRKYGEASCRVETLAIYDDWESLCLVEKNAIRVLGTLHPNGYNMTEGGEGVVGAVPSVIEKISLAASAQWSDTSLREQCRKSNLRAWSSEDLLERHSQKRTEQWKDPVYRENVVSASRAAKKKKSQLHYEVIQVRVAHGQCVVEKREFCEVHL